MIIEQIHPDVRAHMLAHAQREAPRECCGLLVRKAGTLFYVEGQNLAGGPAGSDQFVLDPHTWAQCEDAFDGIEAVVHSHPNASANPSMADRVECERSGLPWVVMGWPSGAMVEVAPSGWSAPLLGREFSFGVLDCWAGVQDYYRRKLGLVLPDAQRSMGFWRRTPDHAPQDLYRDGLAERGGVIVQGPPRPADVLLMRLPDPGHAFPTVDNHATVYLGNGMMFHHLLGQFSRLEAWDHPWQRRTTAVVRHESRLHGAPDPAPLEPGE